MREEEEIVDFVATMGDHTYWSKDELMKEQSSFCMPIIEFFERKGKAKSTPKVNNLNKFCMLDGVLSFRREINRCKVRETVLTTVIPPALQDKAINYAH